MAHSSVRSSATRALVTARSTSLQSTIVWQLRAPRMVMGLLAGAMLAVAGGTYQGVFRNPLADPYLLGVAAGAGLGATFAIMDIGGGTYTPTWTPLMAFAGAMAAVTIDVDHRRSQHASNGVRTLILAGVAVSVAAHEHAQTFLQQQASSASRSRAFISGCWDHWRVPVGVPWTWCSLRACLRRHLRGGGASARRHERGRGRVALARRSRSKRMRFIVIAASSLGTAAIVSAVGLIGFVGIIVPHIVRLLVGTSYRRILPISVIFGAAFLVFADTIARTVIAPSELPLGVVTALVGAPVFVSFSAFVDRSRYECGRRRGTDGQGRFEGPRLERDAGR
jgi:iron complex transport system permease protein